MEHSIEHLNTDCTCVTIDRDALCKAAEAVVGDPAFCRDLAITHPHLLSSQPVFLSPAHADKMQEIIHAIETVVRLPQYRDTVLKTASSTALHDPGPIGVFMGYDFHLSPDGPKLIEINTNAGGALINAYVLQSQRACCTEMADAVAAHPHPATIVETFLAAFRSEWRRQGRSIPLRTIAIVDTTPCAQYLYPEFVLFQKLFTTHGLSAIIADPDELSWRDGALWCNGQRIDLVYNRLTDFDLSQPASKALRDAYLTGETVVSPNPYVHALYANKTNLTFLTNTALLRQWQVSETVIATLQAGIPHTERVTHANPEQLWQRRNALFFKPASGYGGKATYRGDKITKKVWQEILAGDYVAQEIVPPSTRSILIDGNRQSLKVDLRNYTYDGTVQLIAARVYQGQTTNFRTPGGGFAPVFVGAAAATRSPAQSSSTCDRHSANC